MLATRFLRGMMRITGEITNGPLLLAAGQSGCNIILSTGMSTLKEIEEMKEQEKTVRTKNPSLRQYNMEWIEALQTENLLTVMEMVGKASLMREESRGAMFRRDFMDTDGVNWMKNIVILQDGEKIQLRTEPVVVTTMEPPRKVYKYWDAE